MHPALQRLIDANRAFAEAREQLAAATTARQQCALQLSEIEDDATRREAALFAYREFGQGLSLALAEAVTGLPGKNAQSAFLVMAGRKVHQPKGRVLDHISPIRTPQYEWEPLTELEREIVAAHVRRGEPYVIALGLGWTAFYARLSATEAAQYLVDPTGALARHFELSRDDFSEWLSTQGVVTCEGLTKNGSRCKSQVAGTSSQLPIEHWRIARRAGGYCRKHGGG